MFVAPVGQNFDHDLKLWSPSDGVGWLALAGLLVLLGVAVWKRYAAVWWVGGLILLAPTSSFLPLADLMFEHRLYLPMIAFAAGAGEWLARLPRPAVLALAVVLAGGSFARARVWTDEATLWSDAEAKSPRKVRPKLQLARAVAASDPDRAERLLRAALELEPDNPAIHTQWGTLHLDRERPAEALREFEAALRLQPASADALSNRGTALYLLRRWDEAEDEFRRALDRDACHFNARRNLLVLYRSQGRSDAFERWAEPPVGCRFTPAQRAVLRP